MKPLELPRMAGRRAGNCLAILAMFMVLFGTLIGQGSAWYSALKPLTLTA